MHDPMTVAFEIRSPIKRVGKFWPEGYRRPLVTIWHHDPEKGGDDDSCGWFAPRASTEDSAWSEKFAKTEWSFWFSPEYKSINLLPADDLAVLTAVWREVREHIKTGTRWNDVKPWEVSALLMLLSPAGDNLGYGIREAKQSAEEFQRLLLMVLRNYRRMRRPWYQHPKWHIHHWSFQFHDAQKFNRWAFSRCAKCGGRFSWGYCPVSHGWGGSGGPKFLRGEKGVFHQECSGYRVAQESAVSQ